MTKYNVSITVDFENGIFVVPVRANDHEQAASIAIIKLCKEYPIYKGCAKIYNVSPA